MIDFRSLKEVLQTKISTRLIGGFLIVAFLVGFVGIWGINANRILQKNSQIAMEIIELENLLDHSLIQVLQLIGTQTVDDHRDIKSNIENLRRDFDILHQKNDEFIHRLDMRTFDENIQEFHRISNGLLRLHKEKLARTKELEEKKKIGRPPSELETIITEQKKVEADEYIRIEQFSNIIDALDRDKEILVSNIRAGSESLARNTFLVLSFVLLAVFIASVVLGLYIARSIAKPIGELSRVVKAIAGGDLSKRAEVKSKDEIGQLAVAFNEMTVKLKESYHGLEEKVRVRTEELERAKTALEEKNYELERFNKIAVSRELKMIELKKALLERDKRGKK